MRPVILLLILLLPIKAFCQMMPEIPVKVEKITYVDFFEKFNAIGNCKFENSRDYYSKIDGCVDSIAIYQGANVKAGDVLITIDKNLATAMKSQAEANFIAEKSTYQRNLSLLKKKIISEEILNKSKASLENAREKLIRAGKQYNDMVITAPFDGYVGVVKAKIGDEIKMGNYLFSIIAEGNKVIFISLPEYLQNQINKDSLVSVYDVNGQKQAGEIVAISKYVNNNGTIDAKIHFPGNIDLVHGSYMETEIIYNQHRALAIPEKAIMKNEKGNFVFKVDQDNKIVQTYITLGIRTDDFVELISEELTENDLIVTEGLTKIQDGSSVKVMKEEQKIDK